jgi:hypothetical protein
MGLRGEFATTLVDFAKTPSPPSACGYRAMRGKNGEDVNHMAIADNLPVEHGPAPRCINRPRLSTR